MNAQIVSRWILAFTCLAISGLTTPLSAGAADATTSLDKIPAHCKLAKPIDLGTEDPSSKLAGALVDVVLDKAILSAEIPKEDQKKSNLVIVLGIQSWRPGDHFIWSSLQSGIVSTTDKVIEFKSYGIKRDDILAHVLENGTEREFYTRLDQSSAQGHAIHEMQMWMKGSMLTALRITFPINKLANPHASPIRYSDTQFTGKNETVCLKSARLVRD